MAPRIGIPLCLDERGRWRPGRDYLYLDQAYTRALVSAGAQPVLLPLGSDPHQQVTEIEGLLLPGGDDFPPEDPDRYPEDAVFDPVPPRQLAFDRALLGAALRLHLPVLGICYGAQLLALHHGGRLHHHLPSDLPASHDHNLPENESRHPVHVEPHSRLASELGRHELSVNSLHHQAVADPGHGMRVCARAPDGVIEAIEATGDDFEVGVQWHPEKLADPDAEAVVAALVSACKRR